MRFVFLVVIFLYGDISKIIEEINSLEKREIKFIPIERYNIFKVNKTNFVKKIVKKEKKVEKFNIKVKAYLNDMVYIGNRWYKVGESINGYKIVSIDKKAVKFEKKGKIYKYYFDENLLRITK